MSYREHVKTSIPGQDNLVGEIQFGNILRHRIHIHYRNTDGQDEYYSYPKPEKG